MTIKMQKLYSLVSIFGVFIVVCNNICVCLDTRKIDFSKNPGCSTACDKPWLIYGMGENENNTIHYLWSAVNIPSFVIAASVIDSSLRINWTMLQAGEPGAITFTKLPENMFGISFQTLILFNDKNDTGKLDNIPEYCKKYASLSEFEWTVTRMENISAQEYVVQFSTISFRGTPLSNDTKIVISVTAYGAEGRSKSLPHLITTPGSTHIEVVLDDLILDLNETYFESGSGPPGKHHHHHSTKDETVPISGFEYPRWALDMIIVSSDKSEEGKFLYMKKTSLDDEHTPGIFDVVSITSESSRQPASDLFSGGGYLQWRPVCYLTQDEDVNDSTYPNINTSLPAIDNEHLEASNESLMYFLFGNNFKNLINAQTPIAFGLAKDKFYTEFNYTEWTFAMGLGTIPEESFSLAIIIVIGVGVGLPFLMFVVGGIYLIVHKFRQRGEMLVTE